LGQLVLVSEICKCLVLPPLQSVLLSSNKLNVSFLPMDLLLQFFQLVPGFLNRVLVLRSTDKVL
jgi:hypothetical protein